MIDAGAEALRGEVQQLANALERDEDVGHGGRTCGRTSRYTLGDYLGSDKIALYRPISVPSMLRTV